MTLLSSIRFEELLSSKYKLIGTMNPDSFLERIIK